MQKVTEQLLEYAIEVTEIAKKILVEDSLNSQRIKSNEGHDIKLHGDLISEKAIIEFLKRKTGYRILSEEAGLVGEENDEFYWIVDPIDGSLNYSKNIPMSCISISLWKGDTPVLGVINDFNRNEIFTGIVDIGAWLNGEKIKVSGEDLIEKAVLASGFPSNTDYSTDKLLSFVEQVQQFKKIRLIGSAALSTAYVACGRFDAYVEKGIMLWDIAAGIAITVAAGGSFDIKKKGSKYQYDAIISNKKLFKRVKY